MVDAETSVVTLNARSITMGTLSVAPAGPILVSQDGFDLCVKKQALTRTRFLAAQSNFNRDGEVTIAISPEELTCFEYYFTNGPVGMNVAFLQTTERCARKIRAQLGLYQEALYKRHESKDKDGSGGKPELKIDYLPYFGPRAKQKSRHRIMLEFEGEQFALQFVMMGLVQRMSELSRRSGFKPMVACLTQPQARLIVGLVVTASQHLNRPDPDAANALRGPPPEDYNADDQDDFSGEDGRSSSSSYQASSDFLTAAVGEGQDIPATSIDYSVYKDLDLRRTSHSYINLALAAAADPAIAKGDTLDQNQNVLQPPAVPAVIHIAPTSIPPPPKRAATQPSRKPTKRARKSNHGPGTGSGRHQDQANDEPLPLVTSLPTVVSQASVYMPATSMAIGAFKGIPLNQIHITDTIIQMGVYGLEDSTTNTGPSNCLQLQLLDVVRCLLHPKPDGSSAMFIYTAPAFSARLLHRMVLSPTLQRYHDTKDRFNNCNTLALLLGAISGEQCAHIQQVFAIAAQNHPFGSLLSVIDFSLAAEYLGSCFSKDHSTACRVNELVGAGREAKCEEPESDEAQELGVASDSNGSAQQMYHEEAAVMNTSDGTSMDTVLSPAVEDGGESEDSQPNIVPPVAVLTEDGDILMVKSEMTTKCPYTQQTMVNPVENIHCGHNYDESSILQYIKTAKKTPSCPVAGCSNTTPLTEDDLKPNPKLKEYIESEAE